jgi:hypothetical protein
MRNKHSVRILLDPALDHAVTDLARRDGRPVANLCVFLIKEALAARRAEQRPARDADHDARR